MEEKEKKKECLNDNAYFTSEVDTQKDETTSTNLKELYELLEDADYDIKSEDFNYHNATIELIKKLIERLSQLNEVFSSLDQSVEKDSRIAYFIKALSEGKTTQEALSLSGLVTNNESIINSNELEELRNNKLIIGELRKRRESAQHSLCSQIETFCSECDVDAEQMEHFAEYISHVVSAVIEHNIDNKTLKTLWRGFKFEDIIKAVKRKAQVDGRNMQINEFRGEKESGNLHTIASKEDVEDMLKNTGYVERLMLMSM